MQVIEMETPDFKDYSFLFKSVNTNRKITASGENVNWRQINWLRYKKSKPYVLFYKNELNEDQFYEINLLKRGKHNPKLEPPQCYSGPQPISEEKKKDIMDLLPYISPVYKQFYMNKKTKSSIKNTYYPVTAEDDDKMDEQFPVPVNFEPNPKSTESTKSKK